MNYFLQLVTVYSIFIAIIISIIRFRMIGDAYYPFVYLLWVGGLNEIVSTILLNNGYNNITNGNLYTLVEALLLMWFFWKSNIFDRVKPLYVFLVGLLILVWIIDNFFIVFGKGYIAYFSIISALIIVLISINILNDILMSAIDVWKNATFLLCIGFIIYFTYRILVDVFWLYGQNIGSNFSPKVFEIHSWINLLCNLIYALAVLWMQRRQAFTLRY
jgi:hypothetical protein